MANIIDSLLITLGLETKDYEAGQKNAGNSLQKFGDKSEANAKKVNAQSKVMAEGFNKVKNELISLAAVALGASSVKDFVASMTTSQAALGRSALNLGTSARSLDAWAAGVRTVGGTKEDLYATAQAIESIYENFKATGSVAPEVAKALQMFGLSASDMQDPDKFLTKMTQGLSKFKGTEQDKMFFSNALGVNPATFNFLRQAPADVMATVQKMRELSGITDKSVEGAQHLQKEWGIFRQTIGGIGDNIYASALPALTGLLEVVNQLGEAFKKADDKSGGLMSGVAAVAGAVATLAGSIYSMLVVKGLLTKTPAAAAAGEAAEGAVAGGAFGIALRALMRRFLPAAMLTASDDLNANEDAELKKRRASAGRIGDGSAGPDSAEGRARKWRQDVADHPDLLEQRGAWEIKYPEAAAWDRDHPQRGVGDQAGKTADSQALFADLESKYGLPAGILDAEWAAESARGKNMVSKKGALGHFQFMPKTANEFVLQDPFDLKQSAAAAARKLKGLLNQYGGNLEKAVAAYNLGQGNLTPFLAKGDNWKDGLPKETADYVPRVLGGLPVGAATSQRVQQARQTTTANTSTTETNINGPITVVTKATDPDAMAAGMNAALQRRVTMASASTGLTP